ncbi:unnamed protein product, partial [Brugia pahangi]|uniref:Neur_chan_LBD domain-containing protein n=1 Tax=Brugia pahangi TaxID=6280 RepID=A0A0N4T162_BRUPA
NKRFNKSLLLITYSKIFHNNFVILYRKTQASFGWDWDLHFQQLAFGSQYLSKEDIRYLWIRYQQ